MELDLYSIETETNRGIYSNFSKEYELRTRNAYENYLKDFIDLFIKSLRGRVVYDLGCGPGRDLTYFKSYNLDCVGVDVSDGMIEICRNKGLNVKKMDFLSMQYDKASVDGFWAYTSHTVIPKVSFVKLLAKYKQALKPDTGILALGMIEGDYEGWKSDDKYNGAKRYVTRYRAVEIERILGKFFGSVHVYKVEVSGKTYLHCLCKNTNVATEIDTVNAAIDLFNKFSDQYKVNTSTGIELLRSDREIFIGLFRDFLQTPRIIDIGCGPGRDLFELHKLGGDTVGIDISEANITNCKKMNMNALVGDIYNLENYFTPNEFDGAWCNCSVTNWVIKEKLPMILRKIQSIVRPNGYIFIGSVIGNFSGWEIDDKYDSMKRYNNHWDKDALLEVLNPLGTKVYERTLSNTGKKNYYNVVYRNEK